MHIYMKLSIKVVISQAFGNLCDLFAANSFRQSVAMKPVGFVPRVVKAYMFIGSITLLRQRIH
jgi:hypothetical protein